MCKILIVDDEKMIRMGIKQVIPWNTIGIKQVYTAASAREALQIVTTEKPEIVLTDINMAEMTGLELIQSVRKINEETKFLVLTGYDRFDYARECLRMKVKDIHLKPVDEEVLTESIRKIVEEILETKEKGKKESLVQRTQGSIQQLQLENIMREITQNHSEKTQNHSEKTQNHFEKTKLIHKLVTEYSYSADQKLQIAMIVPELYDSLKKYEKNFRAMSVRDICIGLVDVNEFGITFIDSEYRIVIAYFIDGQKSVVEQVQQLSDILKDEFESKPKIVVGNQVDGFAQLYASYNDALYLLEHEKNGFREIVQMYDSQNRYDIFVEVFQEMKHQMCQSIGDEDYVLHIFDSFVKAIDSYNLSTSYVKRCCFEIASEVYYAYINNTRSSVDSKINTYLQSLLNASLEEACEMTKEFLSSLLGKKAEDSHVIIHDAKRYIEEHLGEEISVSNIAAELYVSPNYFSRLFKRIEGEGCNEYIIEKRIDKAKSLLDLTNFKAGKIANMVGYRDANYFTLAFKKHTGMSPIEYRLSIRKSQQ